MAEMALIKYHYAYDESKQVININDVSSIERSKHSYYCVGCGAEMIPRLGKINAHHFAHKVSQEYCGSETYLHKLAKQTIKRKFDSSEEFKISYCQSFECDKSGTCSVRKICKDKDVATFDLKKYYNQCLIESPVQGFIADILLCDSTERISVPVLIEIKVSHRCAEKKIHSGLKIIEIEINDEEDIARLMEPSISESSNDGLSPTIMFYGFDRNSKNTKSLDLYSVNRFYLFDNYSVYVDQLSCRDAEFKSYKKTLLELNIVYGYTVGYDYYTPYYYGLAKAIDFGFKVKSCSICKYMAYDYLTGDFICKLYKKLSTPRSPEPKFALGCNYYRIDAKLMKDVRESISMSDVSITKVERIRPKEYDI